MTGQTSSPFFNPTFHPYELRLQLGEAEQESYLIINFIVAAPGVFYFWFGHFGSICGDRAEIEE